MSVFQHRHCKILLISSLNLSSFSPSSCTSSDVHSLYVHLLSPHLSAPLWLSHLRPLAQEQLSGKEASVHVPSSCVKRRRCHSAQEGVDDGRGVGSEQNSFEGGFIQLNL